MAKQDQEEIIEETFNEIDEGKLNEGLIKENEDLKIRINQLIDLVNAMKKDIREVYASWSWRLTSPCRGIINLVTMGRWKGDIPVYLKRGNAFDQLLTAEKPDEQTEQTEGNIPEAVLCDDTEADNALSVLQDYEPNPWDEKLGSRITNLKRDFDKGFQIVVHLYDKPDSSTFRYACYNVCQYMKNSEKYRAYYFFADECKAVSRLLDKISILIFCRTKWTIPYAELINDAKLRKIPIAMQIDDLVCRVDYVHYLLEMNLDHRGSDFIYDAWFANTIRLEWIAKEVDGFVVTNDYLGRKLNDMFKKDYTIIHNSLNREQVSVSEELLKKDIKADIKGFVIGYFSGSPTHRRDLDVVLGEITDLLDDYDDITFMVVGYMDFPRKVQQYIDNKRIVFKPLVDFLELQYMMSLADVNIVPLEDTVFTNCKSELKFFEAAIAGTITAATPTYAYKNCISDKVDGFLCEKGQWYQTIADIHDGKYDIDAMTERAKNTALSRYYGQEVLNEIEKAYDRIKTFR